MIFEILASPVIAATITAAAQIGLALWQRQRKQQPKFGGGGEP